MKEAKPFVIDKTLIYKAYRTVKENTGSASVDSVSIEDYEKDLGNRLYKLWNRMSSGSYMPNAVRLVEMPKPGGGKRPLGIPTVEDRIAQQAAVLFIGTGDGSMSWSWLLSSGWTAYGQISITHYEEGESPNTEPYPGYLGYPTCVDEVVI